jgi:hypothetical protein
VFPVSPQEILLPPRFRALSHSNAKCLLLLCTVPASKHVAKFHQAAQLHSLLDTSIPTHPQLCLSELVGPNLLVPLTCDQGKMLIRADHTHDQLPHVAQTACRQLRYTANSRQTATTRSQSNELLQQLPALAAMTHLHTGLAVRVLTHPELTRIM